VLRIEDLRAGVGSKEILRGINLEVRSGEVHAIMGPNGSGKSTLSHVLMGKPGYEVIGGSVFLDDTDLLALPAWKRAQAGLFLVSQYPIEVPGVSLEEALQAAFETSGRNAAGLHEEILREVASLRFPISLLGRSLNVDFSGGEKKRNEMVQLAVLKPKFGILDEIDSGLDVDALRDVSRRVEQASNDDQLGVLAITHYSRLLKELRPDRVHVLVRGEIAATGGPELAAQLERTGYAEYGVAEDDKESVGASIFGL
jgi:Fe-S cluster assembly ATP-binding protein